MLRFFIALLLISSASAEEWIRATERGSHAIDQMEIEENSCGIVSQLNAYRFSTNPWHSATLRLTTNPSKGFDYLHKKYYRRMSSNAYMRKRWDKKIGIRPDDLYLGMQEFHRKIQLPKVKFSSLFIHKERTQQELLLDAHEQISSSLKAGFTPILHISRFAKIHSKRGGYRWDDLRNHFVIITGVTPEITEHTQSFSFEYTDPWGGRTLTGTFLINNTHFYANDITAKDKHLKFQPTLTLDAPHSNIGKHLLKQGQKNALVPTHLIYSEALQSEEEFKSPRATEGKQ